MTPEQKTAFEPVESEMYQLLLTAFAYHRKLNELKARLPVETRAFLLEEITALRHMSNGIILHLCNLDDDSSNWSIRAITKQLGRNSETAEAARRCNELLKDFRVQINAFKTKHRNMFIAHRNGERYPDPLQLQDYSADFKPAIQTGLRALEQVWGAPMTFRFRLGSAEHDVDFRSELGLS